MDFQIGRCWTRDEFCEVMNRYVKYYNEQRPCYALDYDTPANYRKRFFKGEIERRDTFANRILSEEPKFIQKRQKSSTPENVSTSENENG